VACDTGHVKAIQLLLLINRCDVTVQEMDRSTPLHYLIRKFPPEEDLKRFPKFVEIVHEMVARGLDVNARNRWGETVLHKAVMSGAPHIVRWLLKNKEWKIELNATNKCEPPPPLYFFQAHAFCLSLSGSEKLRCILLREKEGRR